jgi:nucleotide-binding universal stress UspA family protein
LGVLPPRGNDDLLREAKKAAAEWVESKLKTHGAEGTVEILEGSATKQIVGRAEALDASLVVIGSHGKAGVRDVVLGSVSSRVLGASKTSVLVARS